MGPTGHCIFQDTVRHRYCGVYRWLVNCNGGEGNDGRLALLGAHDQHLFRTGVFFTDKGTWTQNGEVAIYLMAGISTGKCGKGSG